MTDELLLLATFVFTHIAFRLAFHFDEKRAAREKRRKT